MRTAMIALVLVYGAAVAAAEIDGVEVEFGQALKPVPVVEVQLRPCIVKTAGGQGLGFVGVAVSHLPSPYYKITLTINAWDKATARKPGRTNKAIVVLENPVPERRIKWQAVAWLGEPPALRSVHGPEQYYTVDVAFEEYVPKGRLLK